MKRIIREARPSDMTEIMQVMTAAKAIMRQSGNVHQWGEGYPSETVITADMEKHGGYVIEENGQVVAYFAFLPSPEPTYSTICDGEWIDDTQPYHVIHRIASCYCQLSSCSRHLQQHHGLLFLPRHQHPHRHPSRQPHHATQHPQARLHILRHHTSPVWRRALSISENNEIG